MKNKKLLVAVILFLALMLRLIYAYNLPVYNDEKLNIAIAQKCSLNPKTFNLPLGSALTHHPMLIIYFIAFTDWIARGSIFTMRLFFILLGILGLIGLFFLTEACFGSRAAIFALFIATVDRYMITSSTSLSAPSCIFLAPWAILLIYKCANRDKKRYWAALGALFGIGYNIYQLFLLLFIGLICFMAVHKRRHSFFKSPGVYIALTLFIILALPNLLWNVYHGSPNIQYMIERGIKSGLGITPRALLLYVGDLFVHFKDSTWIILSLGQDIYSPRYVICNWGAGITYLLCFLYSFRFFKEKPSALLLFSALGAIVPVSILFPIEPWNNFWYAAPAIFPIMALTGSVLDRMSAVRVGRTAAAALVLYFTFSGCLFLAGPKWGYMSPDKEKSYIGKMNYLLDSKLFKESGFSEAKAFTERAIVKFPSSPIPYYFKSLLAKDNLEKKAALENALAIDPDNPLANLYKANFLIRDGKLDEAESLLIDLIKDGQEYHQVYEKLARVEFKLRDYKKAERYILKAIAVKPDEFRFYGALFFARDAMGDTKGAGNALRMFAGRCFDEPCFAYAKISERFALNGKPDKAVIYANKARKSLMGYSRQRKAADRAFSRSYAKLGNTYGLVCKYEDAVAMLMEAIEIDPMYAEAHRNLAAAYYYLKDYSRAMRHLRRAAELGYDISPQFLEELKRLMGGKEQ